ncbi:MAG: hypothetical protein KTR21_17390 [Rhodobacteraceae bacterium]|nr:hypothetical protein [Paracoccaceae bacterium]
MNDTALKTPATAGAEARERQFTVDIWATSLNSLEIGIMPSTQHQATSDQFTKDMDILGDVTENGKRTGVFAYREKPWREMTGGKRRLVLRLFSAGMHWRSSMELVVGRSLQLTLATSGISCPSYAVNIGDHKQIIQLERSADKWPFLAETFSFFLTDGAQSRFFTLRQKLLSMGQDYILRDQSGRRIAYLDGRAVSLGGIWKVTIEPGHDDPRLVEVLQLFCVMLKFNKGARRHIDQLASEARKDEAPIALDHHEVDLYRNPRRRR